MSHFFNNTSKWGLLDLAGLAWSWIPWRVPWAPIQTRAAGRVEPKEGPWGRSKVPGWAGPEGGPWGRSRVPGRAVGPQQGPRAGRA